MTLISKPVPAKGLPRLFRYLMYALPLLCLSPLFAQPLGERVGPQLPFLTSSARAAAMADAGGAIIDDFSGFGSNPGVLGLIRKSVIDYSTQRVQNGIAFEHLGIAYKTTTLDAIAFSFDILHFGGTDFYTNGDVRKLGYEVRTGLAYGRLLSEGLSTGVNFQALMTTTGPNTVWSFVGDFGFTYTPGKYIRYGLSIKGLGSDYKISAPILQTDVFTSRISKVLALSLVFDYPFADQTQKIVLALQNEKVLGETGLIYKIGIEYIPIWSPGFHMATRLGMLIRERYSEPRFGLGAGYAQFSLDYAYRYSIQDSQPSHLVTLAFSWR